MAKEVFFSNLKGDDTQFVVVTTDNQSTFWWCFYIQLKEIIGIFLTVSRAVLYWFTLNFTVRPGTWSRFSLLRAIRQLRLISLICFRLSLNHAYKTSKFLVYCNTWSHFNGSTLYMWNSSPFGVGWYCLRIFTLLFCMRFLQVKRIPSCSDNRITNNLKWGLLMLVKTLSRVWLA